MHGLSKTSGLQAVKQAYFEITQQIKNAFAKAFSSVRSSPGDLLASPSTSAFEKRCLLTTFRGANGFDDTKSTSQNNRSAASSSTNLKGKYLLAEGRGAYGMFDTKSTAIIHVRSAAYSTANVKGKSLPDADRGASKINRLHSSTLQTGGNPVEQYESDLVSYTRSAHAKINEFVDRIKDKVSPQVLDSLKLYAKTPQKNVQGQNNLNNRMEAVKRYVQHVLNDDPKAMLDLSNLKLNSVFKVADDVRMINLSGNPLTPQSRGLFDNLPADLDYLDLRGTKMNEFPSSFAAKTDCYIMIGKGANLSDKGALQIAETLVRPGPDYRFLPFSTP